MIKTIETAEEYGWEQYGDSFIRSGFAGEYEIIISIKGSFSIYIDAFARTFEIKKDLKPSEIKQLMKIFGSNND